MGLLTVVEVDQTEATLDPGQLPGAKRGLSFRLAGQLLTARLLAATPGRTGLSIAATMLPSTYKSATTARTVGGNSRRLGRLVHIRKRFN
jgi:hypothetical protein